VQSNESQHNFSEECIASIFGVKDYAKQVKSMKQTASWLPTCYKLRAGLLLCLLVELENVGDMFLRNIG
jgi:hypothetical protein